MPASRAASRLALIAAAAWLLPHHAVLAAETLFSAYTGTSHTRDSNLRLVQPSLGTDLTARNVRWAADPFKPAPYYGLRLTRFDEGHPSWGAAIDFTHYKMYAKIDRVVTADGTWRGSPVAGAGPLSQYVQRFEISHGVNVLSVNGVYRWLDTRVAAGRLQPYAGAGLAYYRPHAETTVDNADLSTGYQASGFGYQVLAGAHCRLTDQFGLFVETKFNSGTAKVDIAGGRAETPLRTLHLLAGVSYRF
jgi:opacity protein-like surface antigen